MMVGALPTTTHDPTGPREVKCLVRLVAWAQKEGLAAGHRVQTAAAWAT